MRNSRLPIILAALSIGTCLNFIGIALALKGVKVQATAGQMARERQCRLLPVSKKVYRDAFRRGVITKADLAAFTKGTAICTVEQK